MEWTKFKDQWPSCICEWIWITDYDLVWLKHINSLEPSDNGFSWANANLVYPEVPKRNGHECIIGQNRCLIDYKNKLILEIDYNNPMHHVLYVEYCPFCGYKPLDLK
jgi:hypothetical protein